MKASHVCVHKHSLIISLSHHLYICANTGMYQTAHTFEKSWILVLGSCLGERDTCKGLLKSKGVERDLMCDMVRHKVVPANDAASHRHPWYQRNEHFSSSSHGCPWRPSPGHQHSVPSPDPGSQKYFFRAENTIISPLWIMERIRTNGAGVYLQFSPGTGFVTLSKSPP